MVETQKFIVQTTEERLVAWRELDRAAAKAERDAAGLGQATSDPRVRDLLVKAKALRQQADREFSAILRAIRMQEHSGRA